MPAYDPQRDRGRPEAAPASPVDALLDGLAADGATSAAPPSPTGDGADGPATVTPLTLVPDAAPVDTGSVDTAPVESLPRAAVDPDAESSAWSPTVTPSPVDPGNDRALMRLGVLGAAIGAVALVTVIRQLRRHRL
jgi:hypothetical protein